MGRDSRVRPGFVSGGEGFSTPKESERVRGEGGDLMDLEREGE